MRAIVVLLSWYMLLPCRLRLAWYRVKRVYRLRHIHFYRTVKVDRPNVYMECRCGCRKVEYNGIGFRPIDVEWLSGVDEEED